MREEPMTSKRNPPATEASVRRFEEVSGMKLPGEFRSFLVGVADGGDLGPEYGLRALASEPSERLARPFPLTKEWVWEDEPPTPERDERIAATNDGVLDLGEEGCGASWVLVVTGACRGEVWLATGEGATPCRPRMRFDAWLQHRMASGSQWWPTLVEDWGPRKNIWFAAHALKKALVREIERPGDKPIALGLSSPLCFDCKNFLLRAAAHAGRAIVVSTPAGEWIFKPEGMHFHE
jgi:hypothetical protein